VILYEFCHGDVLKTEKGSLKGEREEEKKEGRKQGSKKGRTE